MGFFGIVSFLLEFILNLIYIPSCGICEKESKEVICEKCTKIVMEKRINLLIKTNNNYYEKSLFLFKYEDIIRNKMIQYKFKDCAYLYKMFSKMILETPNIIEFINEYDIIIPVPIHRTRKRKRGYNQSELIVKELCKDNKIKIELNLNILLKVKNIKPQSGLNKNQRMDNIKKVYKIKKYKNITDKKILVFDDIFTTGSTVSECAKVLKEHGAKSVGILTIAKD